MTAKAPAPETPLAPVKVEAAEAPSSIPMPDSVIRQHWLYQIYVRLARPTLDWVGVAGGARALGLFDQVMAPMDDGTRIITLGFVMALYGIRTAEKKMGVA